MEVQKDGQVALPGLEGANQLPSGYRYTCFGKEILLLGVHYADAITTDAASTIADALNAADLQKEWAALIGRIHRP